MARTNRIDETARVVLAQVGEINAQNRGASQREIAEALGHDELAVSKVLARLNRAGLTRIGTIGPSGALHGLTDAGRIEATGGAVLRLDGSTDAPAPSPQVALF